MERFHAAPSETRSQRHASICISSTPLRPIVTTRSGTAGYQRMRGSRPPEPADYVRSAVAGSYPDAPTFWLAKIRSTAPASGLDTLGPLCGVVAPLLLRLLSGLLLGGHALHARRTARGGTSYFGCARRTPDRCRLRRLSIPQPTPLLSVQSREIYWAVSFACGRDAPPSRPSSRSD